MKIVSLKPALLGALLTAVALPAQAISVYTDPVGAVAMEVPSGSHVMSFAFQHPKIFQGVLANVSGSVLSFASDVPSINGAYYVQVVSGSARGRTETVATISNGSATLWASIPGLSIGDVVALRAHTVLDDLVAVANPAIPDDAVLTLYNTDGSSESYIFSGGDWYENFGAFDLANEVIIHPGEGFVINLPTDTGLIMTGSVSVDPVVVPVGPSFSIVGTINPSSNQSSDSSLGAIFGNVGEDSIVSVYSNDGDLTLTTSYIFGGGDWYENHGAFNIANSVVVESPNALVITPTSSVSVSIPPAFVVQN